MAEIYVPIDYSNLSEVIPEEDDILYSTLSKVTRIVWCGTQKWKSHIIITKSGFAMTLPTKRKIGLTFNPWNTVHEIKLKSFNKCVFKFGASYINALEFKVIRNSNFESKNSLKQRANKFGSYCKQLWLRSQKNERKKV